MSHRTGERGLPWGVPMARVTVPGGVVVMDLDGVRLKEGFTELADGWLVVIP